MSQDMVAELRMVAELNLLTAHLVHMSQARGMQSSDCTAGGPLQYAPPSPPPYRPPSQARGVPSFDCIAGGPLQGEHMRHKDKSLGCAVGPGLK